MRLLTTKLLAALAIAAGLSATAALGQGAPPVIAVIDGRPIDVLGVLPGMTPDQVRAVLEPKGFTVKDEFRKELNYRRNEVVVWSSPQFVSRLIFEKPGASPAEEVTAEFTSSVTGNQLVAATRTYDWTSGRSPLNWDLTPANKFVVETWGNHSGFHIPPDDAHIVYWYRFIDGKITSCPRTPDGMSETCYEGGNLGGPHVMDEYRRLSDVLMRVAIWNHQGKVLRFEQLVDDFQRRDAARALERAEAEAQVKQILAGGNKPPPKPKPTFTGIEVPKNLPAKGTADKAAPVENIPTGRDGGK